MTKYAAVAHVYWELPFAFRLPPHAFICWEPDEGSALFDPKPAVGALHWTRICQFLNAKDVFADVGLSQNDHVYPKHDYKITCVTSGKELPIIQLHSGPSGGFSEARPFTIANIFLCLKDLAEHSKPDVFKRAEAALNNIINLYRFFTQDPLSISLCLARDSYYTTISVAPIPSEWPELPAKEILQRLGELQFGSTLGQDRSHNIGLGGGDNLIAGAVLPQEILQLFFQWITSNIQLEVFHQLLLSAIRRLKTREFALSVVDAQSAFESNVCIILIEALKARGASETSITADLEYCRALYFNILFVSHNW